MIYSFTIFNRSGRCLFEKEWVKVALTNEPSELEDLGQERKRLMFGLIFSLKELIKKVSPTVPMEGLKHYETGAYKLHHFESISGLKFIAITSKDVGNEFYSTLKYIYASIYVEYVQKNPWCPPREENQAGAQGIITCYLFHQRLVTYIESLTSFK